MSLLCQFNWFKSDAFHWSVIKLTGLRLTTLLLQLDCKVKGAKNTSQISNALFVDICENKIINLISLLKILSN